MRLLFTLVIIIYVEAKKKRPSHLNIHTRNASLIDSRQASVYPEYFRKPVPFGHIFRNGLGDPKTDLKQPIDLLELDMRSPKDSKEAKVILQENPQEVQMILKEEPKLIEMTKDEYIYLKQQKRRKGKVPSIEVEMKNETKPWFAWSSIHGRNLATRRPRRNLKKNNEQESLGVPPKELAESKQQYFSKNSFDLGVNVRKNLGNWSDCDDFRKVTNFHPKDIIDIDWVPFYDWSTRRFHVANIHRFSYPTKKLVKYYKEEFGPHINKSIDWNQPKLLLKEALEFLLVAEDRIGLFTAIPNQEIPSYMKNKGIQIPILSMRLIIVDPYLAMVYCDDQFATIMAVDGNEPLTDDEKISEAKSLKYQGRGFPVYRNLEMEKMRMEAERKWNAGREENKFITVHEPIVQSHFLEKE